MCVCVQQVEPCAEQADSGQWQLVPHRTPARAVTLTHKRRPGHVIHLLASSAEAPSQVLFTPAASGLSVDLSPCACVLGCIILARSFAVYRCGLCLYKDSPFCKPSAVSYRAA